MLGGGLINGILPQDTNVLSRSDNLMVIVEAICCFMTTYISGPLSHVANVPDQFNTALRIALRHMPGVTWPTVHIYAHLRIWSMPGVNVEMLTQAEHGAACGPSRMVHKHNTRPADSAPI